MRRLYQKGYKAVYNKKGYFWPNGGRYNRLQSVNKWAGTQF